MFTQQSYLDANISRRLKSDVMSQLPPKTRLMVVLDPSAIKTKKDLNNSHALVKKFTVSSNPSYSKVCFPVSLSLFASQGIDRRGALLEYFHDTGSAKASAARDYVLDLVARDRKLLVFAHHQQVLDAIEEGATQQVNTL